MPLEIRMWKTAVRVPGLLSSLLAGLLVFGASSRGQEPPISSILIHARSAQLLAEVIGRKDQKAGFNAEINRILNISDSTRLWSYFRVARGSHADIILKIQEDQTLVGSETISLTVFNPDDNEKLFDETRNLVDLDNDVSRLITHFLSQVQQEKEIAKKAEEARRQQAQKVLEEAERKDEQERKALLRVICPSVELYANRADQRTVRKVLHENDIVSIVMSAQDEYIVSSGGVKGYVSAACLAEIDSSSDEEAADQGQSFVQVNSDPPGAKIFLDGISAKTVTPSRINVPIGVHTLVIRLEGYDPVRRTVQVSPGRTVTVNQALTPKAVEK
ncbi:MAG TPA: PEGA domain-containing protein [Candidatus Dormibacteraeota bacterium]|jgi:hypothetical protein|nr:PEGA domain-containing protein [Candidatus Dormibacteraeota bacterium]